MASVLLRGTLPKAVTANVPSRYTAQPITP
jgi:hypothetical protein